MPKFRSALLLAGVIAAAPVVAQDEMATATATLTNAEGGQIGTATLTETPAGVLISAELTGLSGGVHGFHFHETGVCEAPFESAGGHYNPTGANHGFKADGGPHAGDMPNIHVPDSGELAVEVLNANVTLEEGAPETLFDDDGTALMIHDHADDYESQPSGGAGDRVACGVVEK